MSKLNSLEFEFENDLREAAKICFHKFKYKPTHFLSMLAERGAVSTAKALLSKPGPSSGFSRIVYDYNRPDLTMEHFVSMLKYESLFTPEEIVKAKKWLNRS